MPSATPPRSSIWAMTLLAVMMLAGPWLARISPAFCEVKNPAMVSMPDSVARLAMSMAGSMPRTCSPCALKAFSSVPSFEPISKARAPVLG